MNVTVKNSALAQELKLLSRVSSTKSTIPALSYTLVETGEGAVQLAATDLEIGFRTSCQAMINEAGTTTIPTKRMLDLLEQMPDGEVSLSLENEQVLVTAGGFRSRIQTFPIRDFPPVPEVEGTSALVPALSLRLLIERARYAITDKSDNKYVLQGALFSLAKSVVALVATDGKRLSLTTAVRPEGPDLSLIIPSKTLDVLTTLCESGDVEISQGERHIFFTAGRRVLVSRALEGSFPKYDRIIPRDSDKKITVDRAIAAAAIRRVCVVADDQQTVVFEAEPKTLRLSARSAGVGDAVEEIPADYDGSAIKIFANGRHVLDFLERATERSVTVSLKTPSTPMLWTDGSDFLNVILVRIQ